MHCCAQSPHVPILRLCHKLPLVTTLVTYRHGRQYCRCIRIHIATRSCTESSGIEIEDSHKETDFIIPQYRCLLSPSRSCHPIVHRIRLDHNQIHIHSATAKNDFRPDSAPFGRGRFSAASCTAPSVHPQGRSAPATDTFFN